MIGYSTLNNVFQELFKKDLVKKIYHSVEIWDYNGERYPAYREQDEFVYVGIDDTKVMNAYVREINPFSVDSNGIVHIGGCGIKEYKGKVGYRIVFFNDYEERNHDDLLIQLMMFTFFSHVELQRVITDRAELLKLEADPKNFTFGATTFYKAIDFTVSVRLERDNCGAAIGCGNWPNPIEPTN